jgi:hypothetical protein
MSDNIEIYSFGPAAPGFEALVRSPAHTHPANSSQPSDLSPTPIPPSWLNLSPLPPAHFLVQRYPTTYHTKHY